MQRKNTFFYTYALLLILPLTCSGIWAQTSQHKYKIVEIRTSNIVIDSTYDKEPDAMAVKLLAPYKEKLRTIIYTPIGFSEEKMEKLNDSDPEGLLSNLIADIIRLYGEKVIGKKCDIGLMNKGGIRAILPKGNITMANAYEILPFENKLCVLTFTGKQLTCLMKEIALAKGEGLSGVKLTITHDGKMKNFTVNGDKVKDKKIYTLATIDYLAEGNDGLATLAKRICEKDSYYTLRDIFIDYIKKKTKNKEHISSKFEARISYSK